MSQMMRSNSTCHKVSHGALKARAKDKLLLPQEELAGQRDASKNGQDAAQIVEDAFAVCARRWCSDLIQRRSAVFAIEDGINEIGSEVKDVANFMLSCCKVPKRGRKGLITTCVINELQPRL